MPSATPTRPDPLAGRYLVEYLGCERHGSGVGTVKGRILDRQGNVVAGAEVRITLNGWPYDTPVRSNEAGWYEFYLDKDLKVKIESLRIEGREIVTQHNFVIDPKTGRTPRVEHPIALGEYSFDVHPCHDRRFAVEGLMEGVLSAYPRKKSDWIARPGQIPYGAMLPRNLENLLVPVAMSSTHVGMSVLRMEPVWMTTGQVAGLAAATALEEKMDVAQLDPVPLPKILKIQTEPGV